MKVYVETDEWYPVYTIYESDEYARMYSKQYDVPDKLLNRYKKSLDAFKRVQSELKRIVYTAEGFELCEDDE